MAKRDAVYARISEDDLGTERGVLRQLEDGRALSGARGGRVVMELSDNDISALSGGRRPDYERLIAAVDARQIDRIIVFHTSRLWRNRRERAEGIEHLRVAGVSVLAVKGPELDMSTAAGRMMAGILGEFDTAESEIKGERVARAALERAKEGRANGAVLYGWQRVYQQDDHGRVVGFIDVEEPSESAVVREIVARLLAGETLRAITANLNDRGVPAPGSGQRKRVRAYGQNDEGSRWNKTSVKKIATRPANVAVRIYHRGRTDEAMVPASWPALITRDDHDSVVALLGRNEPAVGTVSRPGARVHLLSWGIGACGVCGAHIRAAPRGNSRYGTKKLLYVCDAKDCVGRDRDRVDAFVRDVVVERLSREDAADLLSGDDGALQRALGKAEGLRARILQVADDYTDDKITVDQLHRITAKLKQQLAAAEAKARTFRSNPHVGLVLGMTGNSPDEVWSRYSISQRRAVVAVLIESVVIHKVTRRGPGFDPTTVEVIWRKSSE